MFPLKDDIPAQRTPLVNFVFIGLCAAVFAYQFSLGPKDEDFVTAYGMIPARLTEGNRPMVVERPRMIEQGGQYHVVKERVELPPSPVPPWATLLTCMFLHGGLLHVAGNLWFLWIFGDNVEDRFGPVRYAILYLGSGLAAGLLHVAFDPRSTIPTVGASGAIAGVMGSYFVLYPRARVLTAIPIFIFIQFIVVPAPLFLGIWFLFQLVAGLMSDPSTGGVAWWAHVGGFAFGIVWTWWLRKTHRVEPLPTRVEYRPTRVGPRW